MNDLLLLKLSSLGDVVHTFPVLSDIKRYAPQWCVHWAVEEAFVDLVKLHPAVDEVIAVPIRRLRREHRFWWCSGEWRAFLRAWRVPHYACAVDVQGLLKSACLMRCANADRRYGLDRYSCREAYASLFYQEKIAVAREQHAVMRNRLLMAQALDYELAPDAAPDFALPAAPRLQQDAPYLVMLQGSAWRSKLLPNDCWRSLRDHALAHHWQICILAGTEEERQRAHDIAQGCLGVEVVVSPDAQQLHRLLGNAAAVVSLDTGLGHLAGALGVPVVGVFGATDSAKTGILGAYACNMQIAPACLCRDCREHGGDVDNACMQAADAQKIWRRVLVQRTLYEQDRARQSKEYV